MAAAYSMNNLIRSSLSRLFSGNKLSVTCFNVELQLALFGIGSRRAGLSATAGLSCLLIPTFYGFLNCFSLSISEYDGVVG